MTNVPFFANTTDDTHCFQASLRSVLKHFEPEKDFSWEQLDLITHKPLDMWTWPMAGLAWLAGNGYDVVDIEQFDYARFISEGVQYMEELWGSSVAAEQVKHSDIALAQNDAESFVESVNFDLRTPQVSDIKHYLEQGYLVICMLNARKINNEEGFVGHSILITDFNDEGLTLHDPGLPPHENRIVKYDVFESAWGDPNDSAKNLAAIKPTAYK